GLASAVSCVPMPPAIRSPAIASAPARGSAGSIVRTTPFSRIIRLNLVEEAVDARSRGTQRPRLRGEPPLLRAGARTARLRGRDGVRRVEGSRLRARRQALVLGERA